MRIMGPVGNHMANRLPRNRFPRFLPLPLLPLLLLLTRRSDSGFTSKTNPHPSTPNSPPSPVKKLLSLHQGPLHGHGHGLLPSVSCRNSLVLPNAAPVQTSLPQDDIRQHPAVWRNPRSDAPECPDFLQQPNDQIPDLPRPPAEIVRSFQPHRPAAIFSPKIQDPNLPVPGKKLLRAVLDKLQKKDKFGVFTQAVDATEVPDYYDIIKDPMDFGTMRRRITSDHYTCLNSFQKDIYLICDNAMKYNARGTVYYRHAHAIKEAAERILEDLKKAGSAAEMQDVIVKQKLGPIGKKSHKKRILVATERASASFLMGNELGVAEAPGRMFEIHGSAVNSGAPCGNNMEDSSVHSFRAKCPVTEWRRFPACDENPRGTYKPPGTSSDGSDALLSIASGESLHLVPTGHQFDFPYARSLARFAADLGPNVWKIAAEKIRRALPASCSFGPGWIGEREVPPGVFLPKQNHLRFDGRTKGTAGSAKGMDLESKNDAGNCFQIDKATASSLVNNHARGADGEGLVGNAVSHHESRESTCLNKSGFPKSCLMATAAVEKGENGKCQLIQASPIVNFPSRQSNRAGTQEIDNIESLQQNKLAASSHFDYRDEIEESNDTKAMANSSHENIAAIRESIHSANMTYCNENSAAVMSAVNSVNMSVNPFRNNPLQKRVMPSLAKQGHDASFQGTNSMTSLTLNASLAADRERNVSGLLLDQQRSFVDLFANGNLKSQTTSSLQMHANFANLQQESFLQGHIFQHGNKKQPLKGPQLPEQEQQQQQQMNGALYSNMQQSQACLNAQSRSMLAASEPFDPTSIRNWPVAGQSVSGLGNSLLQNLASQTTMQVSNLHVSVKSSLDQPNCNNTQHPDLVLQL